MDVLLATNNAHKRTEIEGICRAFDLDVTIVQPAEIGFRAECAETGTTFSDNAAAKAWGVHSLLRGNQLPHVSTDVSPSRIARLVRDRFGAVVPPVLADDSGVSVTTLDGRPGVDSAVYGNVESGRTLSDAERVDRLLAEMADATDRSAWYTCHALLVLDDRRYLSAQLTWDGVIHAAPMPGDTGFGYDPVFVIPAFGTSVSRIPQEQKDRISHRAQAVSTVLSQAVGLG